MATSNTVLRTPTAFLSTAGGGAFSVKSVNLTRHSFTSSRLPVIRRRMYLSSYNNKNSVELLNRSLDKFLSFAADGETAEVQTEPPEKESDIEPAIEGNTDSATGVSSSSESYEAAATEPNSAVLASLSLYKEALANSDEAKIAEVESFLKSIEVEKNELGQKLETLLEELSNEKVQIIRISAEFNNFRKRAETERLSLVSNAREEVLESLLPVIDNFERAREQIKVEKEGEEKINNSYQSIYKQFVEILGSLRVAPVETDNKPFDPIVSSQAGSRFNRVIDELRQKLNRVYLEFTKTWIRF